MAQEIPPPNTIYSLQVQDDLWFNFAPIISETRKYYERSLWESGTKRIASKAGFLSFFAAIEHYFKAAESNPLVHLYAFLATHRKYEGGDPLAFTLEMSWSVTIDEECRFSNHMGAQKYVVDNPHPRISAKGHSFCASMTKMLHEDIKLMIFAPVPIMRYIIWNALEEKGLEDGLSIVWWNEEFFDRRKTTTLEQQIALYEAGRLKTEASGQIVSYKNKAMKKLCEILLKQWQEDNDFAALKFVGKVLTLKCRDGTEITLEKGKNLPDWFKGYSDNVGVGDKAITILSIEKLALLMEDFEPAHMVQTEIEMQDSIEVLGDI